MNFIREFFQALLQPVKTLLTSPQQLLATPRKLLGLSLPARVAVLMFMFLVLASVTAYWVNYQRGYVSSVKLDASVLTIVVVLVFVIPVVTYVALRLWLEGETSAFIDIDRAWAAGIAELERRGLSLTQAPLFLVVGSPDEALERGLFGASGIGWSFSGVPTGEEALHWYASSKAIFIVASRVGCLSRLAAAGDQALEHEKQRLFQSGAERYEPHGGTVDLGELRQQPAMSGGGIRATMVAPDLPVTAPAPRRVLDIRGTMEIDGDDDFSRPAAAPAAAPADRRLARLTSEQTELEKQRLAYLCQLVCRARQPFCPINGLMTLLPYQVIQRDKTEDSEVQRSAQTDLDTISSSFLLRFPVWPVVTGMENEPGFLELAQRVGPDRAKLQRFGKGIKRVWEPATPEQLGALCTHASGAFEDFAYELFKESDSLTSEKKRSGNRQLYSLICQIRSEFQRRLDGILAGAFGREPETCDGETFLVGGCYFAATGEKDKEQAFVQGVFDRIVEDELNELEWSKAMLRRDALYHRISQVCFAVDALLAVVIGWLVWRAM
jgi:hypothetical protein